MKVSLSKKRVAISEVLGTLIMVAITLIAGAAVLGWVNGQAGVSENAYGASVANNDNFLRERFVIVATNFTGSVIPCSGSECFSTLGVYLYNNGAVTANITRITIATPPGASFPFPSPISFTAASVNSGGCTITPIVPSQKQSANLMPVQSLRGYTVTVPNCLSTDYMVMGQSYLVTVYGLYGSIVPTEVQAVG